jgi:carbonic anhydrase
MIRRIDDLLRNNREYVAARLREDPAYFEKQAEHQHPRFLWIGCSDSRVSPNLITGTEPGDIFVHRNIANLVVQTDFNLLSVLQYAVDVLEVDDIIVCGHHGCGGVKAALGEQRHGLIDHWLRAIRDTRDVYWKSLRNLDDAARLARLVELNVVEQVHNLGKTHIVREAWQRRGGLPRLHGWVYDLRSGGIRLQTPPIADDAALLEICKFQRGIVGH